MICAHSSLTSTSSRQWQEIRDRQRNIDSTSYRGRIGYYPTPKKIASENSVATPFTEFVKEKNVHIKVIRHINSRYPGVYMPNFY